MTHEAFFQFRQSAPLPTFRDLDRVMLTVAVTTDDGDRLREGAQGTVLSNYHGGVAYVVEFAEPMGALATVRGSDLRLVERGDA